MIFSDKLFLNKGRRESGAPKLPKMCVFGLTKQHFLRKKKTKKTRVSKNSIIGGLILNTFRDCENVWDFAFRSIRRLIFSALLTTVWSRFWSWGLLKILNIVFGRDIEAEVVSRFWCMFLVKNLKLKFGQDLKAEVWSRFWSWILTNLWHDLKAVLMVKADNPWVRCAYGNV